MKYNSQTGEVSFSLAERVEISNMLQRIMVADFRRDFRTRNYHEGVLRDTLFPIKGHDLYVVSIDSLAPEAQEENTDD